jgi:hypothetical protein
VERKAGGRRGGARSRCCMSFFFILRNCGD